jgi:hypothetical protein
MGRGCCVVVVVDGRRKGSKEGKEEAIYPYVEDAQQANSTAVNIHG